MRKSKTKILGLILAFVCIFLIAAIVTIVIGKKKIDDYKYSLYELEDELSANKQTVYVAVTDILAGENVEENVNVIKQTIYTGLTKDSYISDDDLGGVARIDIPSGDPVMKNAVTPLEVTRDTRTYQISVVNLPTNLKENEYVDVRLMMPNAEDYVVLSKLQVKNLILESCVFDALLNEDEILRLASATIDAFTITGARLYTVKYVEPTLQIDAVPTYLAKAEIIDLIAKDPNITALATESLNLQARMDLEARLSALTKEQLASVAEGHNLEDTAKSSVLANSVYTVPDDLFDVDDGSVSENDLYSDDGTGASSDNEETPAEPEIKANPVGTNLFQPSSSDVIE